MKMRKKICPNYCGVTCVNGSCPIANIEEYIERGYDVTRNCSECIYYEGCKDCAFCDTEYCAKMEKSKNE